MKKISTSTRQRDRTTGGSDKLTLFLSLLCRSIQSRLFSRSESRPLLKSRAAASLRWSFIFKASSSGPHIMPSSPSLSFSFCWNSPFAQTRAHNLRKKTGKSSILQRFSQRKHTNIIRPCSPTEALCGGGAEMVSASTLRRCRFSSSPSARRLRFRFQSARSSAATFVSTASTIEVQILSSASLESVKR